MLTSRVLIFIILSLLLSVSLTQAQSGKPGMPSMTGGSTGAGDKVELLYSDSLAILNQPGMAMRKLINNVRLRHKGVLMYCDLAIQNVTTNILEAYGNVRLVQGDTITVRGDTMFYYGNTRQANLRGRVSLRDRKMTLTTAQLDYDMTSGIAHYPVPGRIVDRENVLTSKEGYYDTRSKQFTFLNNVKIVNPKYVLTADSLLYNSFSKIATFQGPTKIVSKDGTLLAREGQYNTISRVSNFKQRATVETEKYQLTGDTLNFDNLTEIGIARGNVLLVSTDKKEAGSTIITGDHGRYNGKAGVSRVTGHALVKSIIGQDTLFMRADTLFSFDVPAPAGTDPAKKARKLIGQKNVQVYKSDLQSKCDSLVYDVADSTIYFYKKPILWSQGHYQLEADSITAKMKHNRINVMYLRAKSFVISQDTLLNFNQVKGRVITAYFKNVLDTIRPAPTVKTTTRNGKVVVQIKKTVADKQPPKVEERTTIDRIIVEGNGQSIYFAMDEKNKVIGLNRMDCSKMTIRFANTTVDKIFTYGRPDAQLIPPKELTEEKKYLAGFRWRQKERPTKKQVLGLPDSLKAGPNNQKPIKIDASVKPLPLKNVLNGKK